MLPVSGAEQFKDSFCSKVNNLRKTPQLEKIFEKLSEAYPSPPTWDIPFILIDDVLKSIDRLRPSTSSGPDEISNRLIKILKFEIVDPLLQIINGSVAYGTFPDIWKKGYVSPVHKKGSLSSSSNFRPVVLMSCLGKVLEAVIREKFTDHLSRIIPDNMFGFQAGKSTGDAVAAVLDQVNYLRSQGLKTCLLSMDASSAFDLVSHQLVLGSLARLGVGKKMLDWTESFLKNCSLSVKINDKLSSSWSPDLGAGQGRRFSPDLYNVSTLTAVFWILVSFFVGFADDGIDVVSGKTIEECEFNAKLVLESRIDWYNSAGLALNPEKTVFMGIGFEPNPLIISGTVINPSQSLKFLGITIQSTLSWDMTIDNLCNRFRYAASRIRSEGKYFDCWDKKKLYNGWILGPLHASAIAFLPSINSLQKQKLQVAMNAGIRAVANLPHYGYHNLSEIRSQLKIQNIDVITEKIILCAAWKRRNDFNEMNTSLNGPSTRTRAKGNIPHPKQKGPLGKMTSTIITCGWNRLPVHIKHEENASKAKKKIVQYVMSTHM